MKGAIDKIQHVGRIRECITDHGTQYFANKRDKEGNANHAFVLRTFKCQDSIKTRVLMNMKSYSSLHVGRKLLDRFLLK